MTWKWTPQRVYDCLNYEDPKQFAENARARHEVRRRNEPLERYAAEKNRQTGRTTIVLAEAVAHALNGYVVVLHGRDESTSREMAETARRFIRALARRVGSHRDDLTWINAEHRVQATHDTMAAVAIDGVPTVILYDHENP